jgi:hypothetical protein
MQLLLISLETADASVMEILVCYKKQQGYGYGYLDARGFKDAHCCFLIDPHDILGAEKPGLVTSYKEHNLLWCVNT